MKKIICSLSLIFLIYFSLISLAVDDNIEILKNQISALERQKAQLESTKTGLIDQGNELSDKIEELKLQSQSGLGIIGRYKLSQYLKKAQKLSLQIQDIEKNINDIENEIKAKKTSLENEYTIKITSLMQRLDTTEKIEERKILAEQIKSYQSAKDQLSKTRIDKQNKSLEYKGIEILEHDGPQEIREKADLLSDIANKTNKRIRILDTRISRLKDELNTRKKLSEFTEEISFINERFPRSQSVAVKAVKSDTTKQSDEPKENQGNVEEIFTTDSQSITRSAKPETDVPATTDTRTGESIKDKSIKDVIKSNGTSADFSQKPLNRIEEEIKALEKQKQELKSELSSINEKASHFRKKAEELEKSETRSSGKKRFDNQETRQKKK